MARVLIVKPWVPLGCNNSKIPPAGAMYIAARLLADNHSVAMARVSASRHSRNKLIRTIRTFNPDIVGISAIISEFDVVRIVADICRDITPGIPIMAGGPLASSNPLETLSIPGISAVVQGEGEKAVCELTQVLLSGGDPIGLPGTAVLRDGKIITGPAIPYLTPQELDDLPHPAWHLIDLKKHFRYGGMAAVGRRRYMQICTSRGCPYHCVFCHNVMGKTFRARSPESVIDEINRLRVDYHIHNFEIVDDCFNLDRNRMHLILEKLIDIKDPNLRLQFPNGIRADLLNSEDMALLARAGTDFMSFALETGSPRLQKLIRKNLNIERAVEAISLARKHHIFSNGFFMIGFPGETREEALATVELAESTDLNTAMFFKVMPFSGTGLYEMVAGEGRMDPSDIPMGEKGDYFTFRHNISAMTDSEFRKIFRIANSRFLLNHRRIWRLFSEHPHPSAILAWPFRMAGREFRNRACGISALWKPVTPDE